MVDILPLAANIIFPHKTRIYTTESEIFEQFLSLIASKGQDACSGHSPSPSNFVKIKNIFY